MYLSLVRCRECIEKSVLFIWQQTTEKNAQTSHIGIIIQDFLFEKRKSQQKGALSYEQT